MNFLHSSVILVTRALLFYNLNCLAAGEKILFQDTHRKHILYVNLKLVNFSLKSHFSFAGLSRVSRSDEPASTLSFFIHKLSEGSYPESLNPLFFTASPSNVSNDGLAVFSPHRRSQPVLAVCKARSRYVKHPPPQFYFSRNTLVAPACVSQGSLKEQN